MSFESFIKDNIWVRMHQRKSQVRPMRIVHAGADCRRSRVARCRARPALVLLHSVSQSDTAFLPCFRMLSNWTQFVSIHCIAIISRSRRAKFVLDESAALLPQPVSSGRRPANVSQKLTMDSKAQATAQRGCNDALLFKAQSRRYDSSFPDSMDDMCRFYLRSTPRFTYVQYLGRIGMS